jgi:hypothetical protein
MAQWSAVDDFFLKRKHDKANSKYKKTDMAKWSAVVGGLSNLEMSLS